MRALANAKWRKRMGIEPTARCSRAAGFEDQGSHQAPIASNRLLERNGFDVNHHCVDPRQGMPGGLMFALCSCIFRLFVLATEPLLLAGNRGSFTLWIFQFFLSGPVGSVATAVHKNSRVGQKFCRALAETSETSG